MPLSSKSSSSFGRFDVEVHDTRKYLTFHILVH